MADDRLEADILARLDAGDHSGAVTAALQGYGPAVLGYQRAVLRDAAAADEAFSLFSEAVWTGIHAFRRDSSFLTWSYKLAWSAVQRQLRDPYRRRRERLNTTDMDRIVAHAHSTATQFLRHEAPDRLQRLRESLTPEEQTLLVLRIDRGLGWKAVAEVMDLSGTRAEVAALRKRYGRLKERLRRHAEADGLLP